MNGSVPFLSVPSLAVLTITALMIGGTGWLCHRRSFGLPASLAIACGLTTTTIVAYAALMIFLIRGRTDGASSVLMIVGAPLCLGGLIASVFAAHRRILCVTLNLPYAIAWLALWIITVRFYAK
jgi:hypothetical protein